MYQSKRFLEQQSPFVRLLVLILIILASTLMTFFLGIVLAMPFFGTDIFNLLSQAGSLATAEDIKVMKFFQVVSQLGVFIIPSLLFPLLLTNRIFKYLGFTRVPRAIPAIATIILVFTILPGINYLIGINEVMSLPDWMSGIENWMRQSEDEAARLTEAFIRTDSLWGLLFNLFMIAFLASMGEEMLFRGVLLKVFNDWFKNIHLAVIISALLFSMFHLQFYGFLPRMFLGIIFGYLFVWSGSLWLPVLAHFVNNGSAVLVYYFYHAGDIETSAEDFGTVDNGFLFMFSIIASIGLMMLIYLKSKPKLYPEF